jgi:hypothetical protein
VPEPRRHTDRDPIDDREASFWNGDEWDQRRHRPSVGDERLFNNLAIGRYLTTKDARLVKELVVHTSVSTLSDVAGRAGHISDIYLMPGFRFGLGEGQKWYVMGGVQVPVSGPQSYVWQPNFALVKNY